MEDVHLPVQRAALAESLRRPRQRQRRYLILAGYILLLAGLTLVSLARAQDNLAWASLLLTAACVSLPIAVRGANGRFDVFEPILLVNVSYFLYLVYAPAADLINERAHFFGREVQSALPVGELYACAGILGMTVGYYNSVGRRLSARIPVPRPDPRGAAFFGLLVGVVAIICFSLYLGTSPTGWRHLLTLGQAGGQGALENAAATSGAANYLYSAVNSLIPALMMMLAFGRRSRVIWVIGFLVALVVYVSIGFRYRILMHVFAPVIYFYLLKRRRPSSKQLVLVSVIAFLIVGVVGEVRTTVRGGQMLESVRFGEVADAFARNLNIYQPYLAVVDAIPRDYPFLFGRSHAYVILQPIPRAVWPEKPPAPLHETLTAAFGTDEPARAGAFYPNIGEMYVDFGVPGIVVGMFVFGTLLRTLYEYTMRHSLNRWVLLLYSVALPFLLQVVSRGLFVQIVYQGVYFFGPIFVGMWLMRRRKSAIRSRLHGAFG